LQQAHQRKRERETRSLFTACQITPGLTDWHCPRGGFFMAEEPQVGVNLLPDRAKGRVAVRGRLTMCGRTESARPVGAAGFDVFPQVVKARQ
jgi:hypothetical protein